MSSNISHKSKKATKTGWNYVSRNRVKKILDQLFSHRTAAMISFETIIVISLLLYLVHKISKFLYIWIKGFYTLNSIMFLVNSYLDSEVSVNGEFNEFKVYSTKNNLVIESKDNPIEDIKHKIEEVLESKKKPYKVTASDKKIEITSKE